MSLEKIPIARLLPHYDVKYICWTNYGIEGWKPTFCQTLEDAINENDWGCKKIITKACNIEFKDITE